MLLAHKIALDPTPAQRQYFARAAGTARFTWNWALDRWGKQYKEWEERGKTGDKPNWMALSKDFTKEINTNPDLAWVKEVHATAHTRVFRDLGKAFTNFFQKRANYPTFKAKGVHDGFYVQNQQLWFDGARVHMPHIGLVKMREELRFQGKIMGASVSREADRWFVAVQVEMDHYARERTADGDVGVDLGINRLATLSTGDKIENPKALDRNLERLQRLQRRLSRKVKGSNNRRKARMEVARLHARISNIRKDAAHKLTTQVCETNKTIVIEDLRVRNMIANPKLARSISDANFREVRRQLEYKAAIYGSQVVVADTFFPSSRTCSKCGRVKHDLMLNDRVFRCECGFAEDRDLNAALNLRRLGHSRTNACGQESSGCSPGSRPAGGETGLVEAGISIARGKPEA